MFIRQSRLCSGFIQIEITYIEVLYLFIVLRVLTSEVGIASLSFVAGVISTFGYFIVNVARAGFCRSAAHSTLHLEKIVQYKGISGNSYKFLINLF